MSDTQQDPNRGQWTSKLGFLLAAAGTAVGLGNIWRFPYLTGENGGAAFVFVYILGVIFVGIPLMWNELALGRLTGKDTIGAFYATKGKTFWAITGVLCILVCFLVLGYYSVIAGWTIGYIYFSLTKAQITFAAFAASLKWVMPLFALFMFLTVWIVQGGVEKGIERWCKVMMPLLFALCIIVSIRSVTLPSSALLLVSDFKDCPQLVSKLKEPRDPLSLYLRENFTEELQKKIDTYRSLSGKDREQVRRMEQVLAGGKTLSEQDREVIESLKKDLPKTRILSESDKEEIRKLDTRAGESKTLSKEEKKGLKGALAEVQKENQKFQQSLADGLNRYYNKTFYDRDRFVQVTLAEDTQKLLGQNPHGEDLVRLNRMLLENAYAAEIKKGDPPSAMTGIKYYLVPDFKKIDIDVILAAIGQCFFSLSVGWGLMIVYGSYMKKTQSIIWGGTQVAIADTMVALLGGFMVFPAVFAFGQSPAAGPTLTFQILPKVFELMPGGAIVGASFFFLLMLAALTSSISMLEVPVAYLVDQKGVARKVAAWSVGIMAFAIGIPSALSYGASGWLSDVQIFGEKGFLDIMDFVVGTLGVVVISLLLSLFVGWGWKTQPIVDELAEGTPGFKRRILGISPAAVWVFFIRYFCPIAILCLLLAKLGLW